MHRNCSCRVGKRIWWLCSILGIQHYNTHKNCTCLHLCGYNGCISTERWIHKVQLWIPEMSHQSIYEATCVEYICFHYFWGAKVDTFIESRTTMNSTNRIEMQMPSPCVMWRTTSSNLLASNPFPNKYWLNVSLTLQPNITLYPLHLSNWYIWL